MKNPVIEIYTDGSCHSQQLIGAWAALVFINGEKTILKGTEKETTHNRMELLAVINAIKHVEAKMGKGNRNAVTHTHARALVMNANTHACNNEKKKGS